MATEVQDSKASSSCVDSPSNTMGLIGLIFSLVGIPTLGLASPIGLLLSLVGLRRRPRGLAIAGAIIGGLGTVVLLLFGLVVSTWYFSRVEKQPVQDTQNILEQAQAKIDDYRQQNESLPDQATADQLLVGLVDSWGKHLRYEPSGENYMLRSAGQDGQFETSDDILTDAPEMMDAEDLNLDIDLGPDTLPGAPAGPTE